MKIKKNYFNKMSLFSLDDLIVKTKRDFEADVVEYARKELAQRKWKDVAIQMGYKIEKTDYLDLAGAMIVEHMKVYGPTSIEHYTSVMKERLDPKVYDFIVKHKVRLESLMKKYEHRDYAYNFFSAMNLMSLYMAKPSYDEDSFETPCYFYIRVIVGLFYNYMENDIPPCDALGVPFPTSHMGFSKAENMTSGENTEYGENKECVETKGNDTETKGNDMTTKRSQHVENACLDWIEWVYHEVVHQRISFATPTLFSSGFNRSQKASCFLLQVGDNLEEILDAVGKMGQISKYRGGIGVDISQIRHSNIGSVGMSSGTRNLVLLYDRLVRYVDQTGIRKGAATIYQRPQHPDIVDFLTVVDKEERGKQESAPNIDNAIWMNWMFLKRLRGEQNGKWTLFCPAKAPSLNQLYGEEFIQEYERLEKLYEEWKDKENILKEYINGSKGTYRVALEARLTELKNKNTTTIVKGERSSNNNETSNTEAKQTPNAEERNEVNNVEGENREGGANNAEEIKELEKRIYGCKLGEEKEHYKFILGLIRFTKQIHVDEIIGKITDMQRKWGKPYILNGDAGNFKSNQKNLGYIRCSNLCTEIFEYTSKDEVACCNLGSLVLGNYYDSNLKQVDFERLGNNTRLMTYLLNRVIDDNFYPLSEAKTSNLLHRPIGLGVCGWGDILNKMRFNVDSEQAMLLNKQIAGCIYFNALVASSFLASKFGSYSSFENSPLSEGKFQFDLWQEEYKHLEKLGLLNKNVRKWENQLPLAPASWGQRKISLDSPSLIPNSLSLYTSSNQEILKNRGRHDENTFSSQNGEPSNLRAYTTENTLNEKWVEPTWDALRMECFLGMRNSLLIARMPTASSASISGSTESAEIHNANIYTRNVLAVSAPVVNYHMIKDLREINLWNNDVIDFIRCCEGSIGKLHLFVQKFPHKVPAFDYHNMIKLEELQLLYRTVWEVSQKTFIQQSADAGIYICQGHSFNLWIPDPTAKQLKMAMLMSFDLGLKTLNYYVRRLPAVKPNAPTIDPSIAAFGALMRSDLFLNKKKGTDKVKSLTSSNVTEKVEVCKMEEGCLFCAS